MSVKARPEREHRSAQREGAPASAHAASALPDDGLVALAAEVGAALKRRGIRLATAESCTGGLVAAAVTAVAGSSEWFEFGFVAYANRAKAALLEVPEALLREHGAVSEPVARAMAEGACRRSGAEVAVAVTGIAGPGGATPGKPVGTVCFAWAGAGAEPCCATRNFPGDRAEVRRASAEAALAGVLARLRATFPA